MPRQTHERNYVNRWWAWECLSLQPTCNLSIFVKNSLSVVKNTIFKPQSLINCGGKLIDLSSPQIMAILNITPDSFYEDSRYIGEKELLYKAECALTSGAKILDIGAYSSRPGAKDVSCEEEFNRLSESLLVLKKHYQDVVFSVDTFRSDIVQKVYDLIGPFIVNDISSGDLDKKMIPLVGKLKLPYISMHMKGNPRNMQDHPQYTNLVQEILSYFSNKIFQLKEAGVNDIIIDPGFGFGKNLEHNFELLRRLDDFLVLGKPILVGLSRKSMFYKPLSLNPSDVLASTIAGNMYALEKGASILRVHDVMEARQTIQVFSNLQH